MAPPPIEGPPSSQAGHVSKGDWKSFVPGAPASPISAVLHGPLESGALPDTIMEWVQASVDELTSARNTLKVSLALNGSAFCILGRLTRNPQSQLQADNLKEAHLAGENAMEVSSSTRLITDPPTTAPSLSLSCEGCPSLGQPRSPSNPRESLGESLVPFLIQRGRKKRPLLWALRRFRSAMVDVSLSVLAASPCILHNPCRASLPA